MSTRPVFVPWKARSSRAGSIVQVRGSIPSYESAKLLVREDGSMTGTIGGGCVEAEVWNAAREVIETERPKHMSFNLGQDAAYDNGLICGGQLDVFVEPVDGGGVDAVGGSQLACHGELSRIDVDREDAFRAG